MMKRRKELFVALASVFADEFEGFELADVGKQANGRSYIQAGVYDNGELVAQMVEIWEGPLMLTATERAKQAALDIRTALRLEHDRRGS